HLAPVLAFEWAAEDDEALVDEGLHELRVLVPVLLLAHGTRPVPRATSLAPDDPEVQSYPSSRTKSKLPAGSGRATAPEPGFARREATNASTCSAKKKGAHGGNMVSPMLHYLQGPTARRRRSRALPGGRQTARRPVARRRRGPMGETWFPPCFSRPIRPSSRASRAGRVGSGPRARRPRAGGRRSASGS